MSSEIRNSGNIESLNASLLLQLDARIATLESERDMLKRHTETALRNARRMIAENREFRTRVWEMLEARPKHDPGFFGSWQPGHPMEPRR